MGNQQVKSANDEVNQIYNIFSHQLIRKQHLSVDSKRVSRDVLKQLFQSFTRYTQYSWSEQISPLLLSHFSNHLNALWTNDKQRFYRQMLQNSGMLNKLKIIKNYQNQFYSCQASKNKQTLTDQDNDSFSINNKIQALNCSIMDDESQVIPIVMKKVPKLNDNRKKVNKSCVLKRQSSYDDFDLCDSKNSTSQYYDTQILRSSVIVPETVFVERLDEQQKQNVNNMLDFYKSFSQSLQQMVRSVSLMACPLKHFEIMLKRKVSMKKIRHANSGSLMLKDTRQAALFRKKQQFNNTYLLIEIKDFTDAYTEFIWKFLNLYRIMQTDFSNFITMETAYGVVLKIVWTFTSWIGQRGYQWQENQISFALQLLNQQQKTRESKQKKKKKQNKIVLDEQNILRACALNKQTSPQKYLKQIVIIYRELSKKCTSADQLILYYEVLFQQVAKRNCCQRMFRMQSIIDKLLKMQDSCGQICYAWTTWNLMVQIVKKTISSGSKQKQVQQDFKKFLIKVQKSRIVS